MPSPRQLMYSVPLYFQVTARASNTVAGAHLFPAVAGNAVGGMVSGLLIKRSVEPWSPGCRPRPPAGRVTDWCLHPAGRAGTRISCYLALRPRPSVTWSSSCDGTATRTGLSPCTSFQGEFALVVLRARRPLRPHLLRIASGFGTGIAQSAVFISLQAAIHPQHKAAAASGLFLTWPVGMTLGLAAVSATMLDVLRKTLDARLIQLGIAAAERDVVRLTSRPAAVPHKRLTVARL